MASHMRGPVVQFLSCLNRSPQLSCLPVARTVRPVLGSVLMDDVILSPDTKRLHRLPPGQARTHKWPVLHEGVVPPFEPARWDLTVFPVPYVDQVRRFTWAEFAALPRVKVFAD